MYISIKNQKNFDQAIFDEITKYIISKDFTKQFLSDVATYPQKETRSIISITPKLYLIRHSEFAFTNHVPTEVFLSAHESYGLLDLFKLGVDANKSSMLYWFVFSRSKFIIQTQIGLICKNADVSGNIVNHARTDDLWIAGNATSTVLALDSGSSHLVT